MTTRKKAASRKKAVSRKSTAKRNKKSDRSKALPKLPAGVTNLKIDPRELRDHEMRPANVAAVQTDRELQQDAGLFSQQRKRAAARKARAVKHLDVKKFGDSLHAALKDNVVGYCWRLNQKGSTIWTGQWNWAQTPADNSVPWNPDKRMHVASVSKLITAIAMTRLLDDKGISYDAKIIDFLPTYWVKGLNVNKITFRHLMTHTSGFVTANGETDYLTMKLMVLLGVFNRTGTYDYENMNFGLCRILIPIINGNVNKNAILPDFMWDLITITGYIAYVQSKVFSPAGVTNATVSHPAGGALAYRFPNFGGGWNSGNLMTVSGGAGWIISVNDLLKVMGTFRRKGTIMSTTKAQKLLDNGFGLDVIQATDAGTLYNKNGLWQDGSGILGRVEQSLAYFLPEDMELVVLVNSPVGAPRQFFRTVVTNVYLANLK